MVQLPKTNIDRVRSIRRIELEELLGTCVPLLFICLYFVTTASIVISINLPYAAAQ